MKLKYYLRGLGLGTVLTAIIMGVVLGNPTRNVSDEDIIKRAKQLGMVEAESTLSSYSETAKNPEVADENDDTSSDKEVDEKGKEIFEKINEGESETAETVSQVDGEAPQDGKNGEESELVEAEEDIKLASDDAGKTASADLGETKSEEEGKTEGTESESTAVKEDSKATESKTELTTVAEAVANQDTTEAAKTTENTGTATSETVINAENTGNTTSSESAITTTDADNSGTTETATAPENKKSETTANTPAESSADVNYVVVDLPSGSESDDCARILREAGIIKDGVEFNKYLISSGLDRRIRSGTKQIPKGSSFEEIAAIITK